MINVLVRCMVEPTRTFRIVGFGSSEAKQSSRARRVLLRSVFAIGRVAVQSCEEDVLRLEGPTREELQMAIRWAVVIVFSVCAIAGCELDPKVSGQNGTKGTGNASEQIVKAREAIIGNRFKEAHDILTALIEKDGANAQAYMLRGIAHMRESRVYPAVKDLSAAVKIAPTVDGYYNLGNALQQSGFYERASGAYRAALELQPNDPEIILNLAANLIHLNRVSEGMQLLERAMKDRPNDPQPYTNMGIAYHQNEDYSAAESSFQKALEVDPNYYQAEFNLAKNYQKMGKDALAAKHYKRYLDMRPNAPDRGKIEERINGLGGDS
ncbi:MAG: hypothetical protein CO108_28510 [Deltaproteobacteria bacterium CG_4_9_14_3_um_filter_63_12]|nr:MAG: hypothetical protein CO108_28510 [Deltaproteobacteria bacterium CG_4_9_14_3_um_filter_63_12]